MSDAAEDAPGAGDSGAPTVFVVDDDAVVRAAVRAAAASVELACEAHSSAASLLAALDVARPGCVLIDIRLPGMGGLELHGELIARGALWPIIFISGYADVTTAVQVLRAGALDLLEKPIAASVLVERLQEAVGLDRTRREAAAHLTALTGRLARLTPREREVLGLIAAGQASKAIAASLTLSRKTVETHRAKLMVKTGATSLAELIRLGLLLDRDPLAALLGSAYGSPFPGRPRR
ncbi:MAG: response regulator [Deltaproteobacteria bacterium]|nr:response regulator [Deltaproteobacteria bacterium]